MSERMREQQKLEQISKKLKKAARQERQHRKRKRIIATVLAWVATGVAALALLAVVSVGVLVLWGRNNLRSRTQGAAPNLALDNSQEPGNPQEAGTAQDGEASQEASYEWQEGWIRYGDKIYEYNDEILTFLVMGIDKKKPVQKAKNATDGGQSDGLFLAVANPETEEIKIIAVNRDTMVDVYMYGLEENGIPPVIKGQITLQHGFGDGLEQSCEATVQAVSKLFYDLPIHGYAAVNMGAIPELTELVGGVELSVMEDLTKIHAGWTKGAVVSLAGEDAYDYVHYRDTTVFESARGRLERQKQFLSLFVKEAMADTRKDLTLPVRLYRQLSKYMVTDISVDEVTYLATQVLDYHFDQEGIYTMEGTTIMGEKFEEFYPDYDALKDLIIRVFYREVQPEN